MPQGGGDPATGHRCPGEHATEALLRVAVRQLAALDFELLPQDLRVPRHRFLGIPRSGVVMTRVRPLPRAA